MNRILLFLGLLLCIQFKVSAQTCAPVPVPFLQSFSGGALPTCWTNQNPTSTSTSTYVKWRFSGSAGYGATGNGGKPAGTFAWVDASSPYADIHTVELISPQIDLTGLTNPYIKFEWFKNHLTSSTGTLPNYSNNEMKLAVNDGSGWVQIWSDTSNDPDWRTVGVPLAASYVGATVQLKFTVDKDVAGNGYFYDDVLLDEVQVIQAPTCFVPVTSAVTNIVPDSGTLNWSAPAAPAPAPAGGYEYYYSTTNTPPTAGTVGTVVPGLSATITPLVPGTTYYWWVRSVCSASDKSLWAEGEPFTPGQIGGGTATHAFLPVYSCSGYNYSQQIYMAPEVAAAVGTNNYITSIKFFVSSTGTTQANYNQWVVYMGNTAQADFATTTSWVPAGSLTQVYSGTLPAMTAGTWIEIPLSTPFLWDGTSNVVIGVDENSAGTSCTANWGSYTAGANRGILYYNTSNNPDPLSPPTATSRYSVLPRLQLTGTVLPPCTNAAPTNIAVNNITTTSATVSWTAAANATYVVRYRVLPSGAWQTINVTTPFTNSVNIPGLVEQTQYELQIATVCGSQGAFSPSVNFTTPALTYCNTGTGSVTNGYISNITMLGTNVPATSNNSGPSTYTDYSTDPTKTITLLRNSANNTLSVGRTISSSTYSTYAWIDFNGDGVFNNNPSTTPGGERIMNLGYSSTTPVTANFSVPANAYMGTSKIKMRVIVYFLTPADACSVLTSNGEVEDYEVKFIDLQPCTTAAPSPVNVSNLTSSSAYVSWLPTANATYIIRWRQGTAGAWLPSAAGLTLPAGQAYHTIPGLNEQTAYQVQVATICNGSTGAFGPSVNFTTPSLSYCNMIGTGTNDYISNVTVTPTNYAAVNNNSLQTNYISYATPVINLEIGSSGNKIEVSKGWTNTTYSDAVSAWIDFDRDGIFAPSEQILAVAANTTTPVANNNFSVPAGAYNGPLTTTMRVVLRRTSAPVMCTGPVNGEVEDYTVKLRPCSTAVPGTPTFSTITHNSVNVNWTPAANNSTYLIQYRPVTNPASAWTSVSASAINGNPPMLLTGLTPATQYEVQIAAVCGSAPGNFTPIRTFTTRCDPTPPNVVISNVTANSAVVTWNPLVVSATYTLRWREVGSLTWNTIPAGQMPQPPLNSYTLNNLESYKTYEVQVANICNGETDPNNYSNPQIFTTVRLCEVPPPGFTITQLSPTSAEVVWDAFQGATYILRYRKVGIPSWTNIPVNTNTYTITGLLELTKYEMQVVNVCSGTPGNYTPLYYFTTPTVTHCPMEAANSGAEYISKVTANPNGKPQMINQTTGSTYSDFTGNPLTFIEMVQGSSNNQIIIDKNLGTSPAGVAVWIDFDRNGTFDLNERILADGPNSNPTATATFSVPSDAFVSMTDYKYVVMRVAMAKDAIPVNCTSFDDGEVEDYTVRISKQPYVNTVDQTEILIYPNPVKSVLNVKNISAKAKYKIYGAGGRLISSGLIVNNKIDVSGLINGVYIIDIDDAKGTTQKKFIKE